MDVLRYPPERIVCLTEETVETLYLLDEDQRIVGLSGSAVRPPRVRREKPRISSFISADVPKILALGPDLARAVSVPATSPGCQRTQPTRKRTISSLRWPANNQVSASARTSSKG